MSGININILSYKKFMLCAYGYLRLSSGRKVCKIIK